MLFKAAHGESRAIRLVGLAIIVGGLHKRPGSIVSERLATELEHLLDGLAKESKPVESATLARVAEHLAKSFGVKPDEVAILTLTHGGKILKFLIPEKFQAIGTIPLSSATALAARTAREKRPDVVNNFGTARHASVFEAVPLGRGQGEQIHKIMSAPILVENKVVGVVQISRKGSSPDDAGPDFTQQDLRELISSTGALGRFIQLCKVF